ncbi:MAG: hypothetical protein LUH54_01000 [Firmicutes bacterium]|nr:hypothetical protein [Bacillota bacterium]
MQVKHNRQNPNTEEYIRSCEGRFESEITEAADMVKSLPSIEIVAFSGPSSSGKTTASKRLKEKIEASDPQADRAFRRVHSVSIDDFFKPARDVAPKVTKSGVTLPDFESANALDLDDFETFVRGIEYGKTLSYRTYDFKTRDRGETESFYFAPSDIIIFEGIQANYPEVTEILSCRKMCRIYISVEGSLESAGEIFSGDEIRLMRRIVRDSVHRNSDAANTLFLWEGVRENEISNIEPYITDCDFSINSMLEYEIGVLKPRLLPLISKLDGGYGKIAADLEARLSGTNELPASLVPAGSILREFID